MPNGNIPNTGQRTLKASMQVKSFVSPENPTPKQIEKLDSEVNAFLASIDNAKRFLNGRNAYSIGNRNYVLVWYLERIPEEPVTTPFGKGVRPVQPAKATIKNDEQPKDNPTEEKKA